MRILSLNIQSGGGEWGKPGSRARRLFDYLAAAEADILILSEYQEGTSATLVTQLADAGWPHTAIPMVGSRRGAVAVLSRLPLEPVSLPESLALPGVQHHIRAVQPQGTDLTLWAAYGPIRDYRYREFWAGLNAELARTIDTPWLLVGDLNSGEWLGGHQDSPIWSRRQFADLIAAGTVDLWRRDHPAPAQEHTWISRDGRYRYRIDHAVASPSAASLVSQCEYDHRTRTDRLSDHSALVVDIDLSEAECSEALAIAREVSDRYRNTLRDLA